MVNVSLPDIGVATQNPKVSIYRPRSNEDTIQAAGAIGGDLLQGTQQLLTNRAVGKQARAFEAAATLEKNNLKIDPETGEVLGILPEDSNVDRNKLQQQIDSVRKEAGTAFTKIRSLMKQKGIKASAAQTIGRIESDMRRISAMAPGFEDVVQQEASEILGFDPTGYGIRKLFEFADSEDKRDLLPVEKEALNLQRAYQGMGVNMRYDQALSIAGRGVVKETNNSLLEMKLASGDMTAEGAFPEWLATVEQSGDISLGAAVASHLSRVRSGEAPSFADTEAFKATINNQVENQLSEFRQIMANGGQVLTQTKENELRASLREKWKPVYKLAEDTTRLKLLENHNDVLAELSTAWGWEETPLLMHMVTAYGEGTSKLLLESLDAAGTIDQWALGNEHLPELMAIFGRSSPGQKLNYYIRGANDLFSGKRTDITGTGDPNNRQNRQARVFSAQRLFDDAMTDPEKLNDLVESWGDTAPDVVTSRVAADPVAYRSFTPENKQKFRENFYKAQAGALNSIIKSVEPSGGGEIDSARLRTDEDGNVVLVVTEKPNEFLGGLGMSGQSTTYDESDIGGLRWINQVGSPLMDDRVISNDLGKEFQGKIKSKEDLIKWYNDRFQALDLVRQVKSINDKIREIADDNSLDTEEKQERIKVLKEEKKPIKEEFDWRVNNNPFMTETDKLELNNDQ